MKELRFATELGALESECGIKATDILPDELAALLDACRLVDHPFSFSKAHLFDLPARAGNLVLRPLSIGACVWYQHMLQNFDFSADRRFWCLVYALAYGRNAEAFEAMYDKAHAEATVLEMCRTITCTKEELEEAVDMVLARESNQREQPKTGEQPQDADWEGLVAQLEVQSGILREEWLWGRSRESTLKTYREMKNLLQRMAGSPKGAQAEKELDDAIANLARVKAQIYRRVKGLAK